MRPRRNTIIQYVTSIAFTLLLACSLITTGCGQKAVQSNVVNGDSLLTALEPEWKVERILQLCDSLEQTGTLTPLTAKDIQMSMVPSTFPQHEHLDMYASMVPAKEVGGDLYGYVINDDRLYFCEGDVSGKGVPASLFMAQATRLFRTLAAQQMMPADICTRINEALCEDNEQGMFVTMFTGLVDLKTGHLTFCNAGHNPPVIDCQFLSMLPNAPIGLWPGLDYEGEEIESIKGKTLFIYTDGLNEAENREQQQFGDDRLLNILSSNRVQDSRQTIETMTAEVQKHRAGAEPNDDLTMMCIRIY